MISGLLLVIVLAFVFVISIDVFFYLHTLYSRIHIGCWKNDKEWINNVEKRAKSWLLKTPVVQLTDNSRLIIFDMLRGRYKTITIQSWQEAGLLLGLLSNEEKHVSIIRKYIESKVDIIGSHDFIEKPKNIDACLLGYALMQQNVIPISELSVALDTLYQLILDVKGDLNTVPYRKNMPAYRFVDTLGFICPFLIAYSQYKRNSEILQLVYRQVKEYDEAFHDSLGVPAHCFDIQNSLPMGVFDWGRGNGWYIFCLIECHNQILKYQLEDTCNFHNRIIKFANIISKYQLSNGGFSDMLFNKYGFTESSSTILCGLLLQKAEQISNSNSYSKQLLSLEKSLMMITQRNGAVDYCQGDTKGIGYYSMIRGRMPFVQGLVLKYYNQKKL